jgi:hypothetical protein
MSGERIVLIGAAKYGTLEEKHQALTDLPGPKSGKLGVLEKIESYLIGANHLNKRELARRTGFFSADQRNHIVEEVKAQWALRRPYKVGGYQVVSYVREGNKNVSLQYSFRNLKTGRFERPKKEEKDATQ